VALQSLRRRMAQDDYLLVEDRSFSRIAVSYETMNAQVAPWLFASRSAGSL
jgi:hypothetical protein